MTTTDTLREAARVMRARAEAATGGRWSAGAPYGAVVSDREPTDEERRSGHGEIEAYGGLLIGESFYRRNAEHVAGWSPAVALAVADWLDYIAHQHEPGDDGQTPDFPWDECPCDTEHYALAVATAYLNGVSP